VDRRSLVRALGGSFAGAVVAPSAAFATSKDVSPDLPGYYANELAKHYATDVRLGARPLLETVTAQHLLICRAAQVAPTRLRGDLLAVAVAYAAFAGWLHLDLGDLHRAWQWRSEALELAHRTGDRNLLSYALANLAAVRVDAGDGPSGAELARAALADTTLCRKAQRYALREAAHAHALTGDRDGVDRALDQGADLLATGDDDTYPWGTAWQASPSYVEAQRATCYGRTGHASEAAGLWEHVLAHHPPDARRDQGVYLVRYASALLHSEGPSAALAPAAAGIECLRHTSSARMRCELVQLRNTVGHRRDTTAGRDLYDLLRQVA
jgi:hypothetical protein